MSLNKNVEFNIKTIENFSLSEHTAYGLGGKVKRAYFPKTEEEAVYIFDKLKDDKNPFFILGNGSNILAAENLKEYSLICTKDLKGIELYGDKLIYGAGVSVAEILDFCIKNGLSGTEFLFGIPATAAGLAVMNAGAGGRYISDILYSCTLYDGKLRNFLNNSCCFGNKYSTMRDVNCIVLSCVFNVERSSSQAVIKNIKKYSKMRSSQPKGRSCGCVFKNPKNTSAGKLIDLCGLKGSNIGGAYVSEEHANFIINRGGSSNDVFRLIKKVKEDVYENSGIKLEEEVVYIGDFNDTFC